MGDPKKQRRHEPIPREEPADPPPDGSTTVRPPGFGDEESDSATYRMLRDSCRTTAAATSDDAEVDEEQLDDELAIEAEVVRLAMERQSKKPSA